MNVNGVPSVAATSAVEPVGQLANVSQASQAVATSDIVEISTAARLAAMVQELPDIRADLVAKVKAEIAAGTYETAERMDVAIDRLLDDILAS